MFSNDFRAVAKFLHSTVYTAEDSSETVSSLFSLYIVTSAMSLIPAAVAYFIIVHHGQTILPFAQGWTEIARFVHHERELSARLVHHERFLNEWFQRNIIPYGFHSKVTPCLSQVSSRFWDAWNNIQSQAALNLLNITKKELNSLKHDCSSETETITN